MHPCSRLESPPGSEKTQSESELRTVTAGFDAELNSESIGRMSNMACTSCNAVSGQGKRLYSWGITRAWERVRNGRTRGRAPAQFVARGCGPQNASPLVPRRACAAVRPAQAHRTGVASGPAVFLGAGRPTATSSSICKCWPPTRPARSPGAAMPHPSPQRHQGGWGVAPEPPAGCKGPSGRRSTAESDPGDPHADVDENGILSIFKISKNITVPQAN